MVIESQIQLAIEALVSGEEKSVRKAATKYGVSKSTLHDRMLGKHEAAVGCGTALSATTETLIVSLLLKMSDISYLIQ